MKTLSSFIYLLEHIMYVCVCAVVCYFDSNIFIWQTYNSLFIIRSLCKYFVEHLSEELLIQQFDCRPPNQDGKNSFCFFPCPCQPGTNVHIFSLSMNNCHTSYFHFLVHCFMMLINADTQEGGLSKCCMEVFWWSLIF